MLFLHTFGTMAISNRASDVLNPNVSPPIFYDSVTDRCLHKSKLVELGLAPSRPSQLCISGKSPGCCRIFLYFSNQLNLLTFAVSTHCHIVTVTFVVYDHRRAHTLSDDSHSTLETISRPTR